jgi:hypothetical protein
MVGMAIFISHSSDEGDGVKEPASTELQSASSLVVPRPAFDSVSGLARHITIAGFSGLIAGVTVGGLGSRLFMRLSSFIADETAQGRTTEAGFTVGEVTFGGTLELIVFVGIFTGLVGAVFYVVLFPWLAWAGTWRGVAFGLMMFAAGSATSDVMNTDNIDFFILKNEPILIGMILLLFIGFGVVIDWMYRVIDRYAPEPGRDVNAVYYVFSALGLVFVGGAFVMLFTSEGCDCEPPIGVAWSMTAAAVGTIAWWVARLATSSPKWLGIAASVVGYAGTLAVLVFGLIRALSDAAEIIR